MKQALKTGLLTSALAMLAAPVFAAPAGTLLFTKGDLQIINAAGVSRVGKAGDVLQPGERLVTPEGAVCQIRLWDGSLIGVRPDTELKVELPDQASARAKSVIQMVKGGLRVINVDLRDGKVHVPITLQSPTGIVDLTNADAESRVVSAETLKKAGVKDPGLYTRVQIGKGTIRTGAVEVPIAIRTVAFTPTIDVAPTLVSSPSTGLFASPTLATSTLTTATLDPKLTTSLSTAKLDPKLSTSTLSPTTSTLLSPTLASSTLTAPTLSTATLSSTLTSPTLTTTSLRSPTLSPTTLTAPTLSTATIVPTTYTAPTLTTTMISSTTLSSPTLTKTTTTSGTTTTFTSKTGSTLTLRQ